MENQTPTPGLTTLVEVVRVLDGDTVEVEIKRRFPVRLLDCWVKDGSEEDKKARDLLEDWLLSRIATLHIPSNNPLKLTDINSFNRILGHLYIDNENVGSYLVEMDLAEKTKEEQEKRYGKD